jgi:hypothetical protein
MLVYPQLSTGALSQFPVQKRKRMRTVINRLADGSTLKLADPTAETTEWQLSYSSLTDSEALALEEFFKATEGSFNVFTFLDPTANLLAWSELLEKPVWTAGPMLTLTAGMSDPFGGISAWRVRNAGVAAQALAQTLAAPGAYVYCFSLYARSPQPAGAIRLVCGENRADRALENNWRRFSYSGSGDPVAEMIAFGLEVPPGVSVDVCGLQVEPQTAASVYKASCSGGVYTNASFATDSFSFTTTGPNRHSVMVHIVHAHRL